MLERNGALRCRTRNPKMQKNFPAVALLAGLLLTLTSANAAGISVGAAPKGDAHAVATKIIKKNHSACKKISGATRRPDGSIIAQCNDASFLVFTVFNPNVGRTMELALNCSAAKKLLNIDC